MYIYIEREKCEPVQIHAQCNVEQSAVPQSSDVAQDRFLEQHSQAPYRGPSDLGHQARP